MTSSLMLESALAFAGRGLLVFPLHTPTSFGPKRGPSAAACSCSNTACESQGKHPRTPRGLHDATTDPSTVRAWWNRWPDANIGLPTGLLFDALDLDGDPALDAIDIAGPPDCGALSGPMAVTGRGLQIYFRPTGAGNRTALLPGVDWRGAGGYVVAVGSLHHLGVRYTWAPTSGLGEPLVDAPTWLTDLLINRQPRSMPSAVANPSGAGGSRYGLRAIEGELGRLAIALDGTRNDSLVRAAYRCGQLVAGGELDAVHAATELLKVAARIGLGDAEAVATITSGMTSGAGSPRRAAS